MSFSMPKGWDKDSDKLFIHSTGIRIQFMTYRSKEGWYLVPIDLDQPVVEFEPTPEGRDKAFEAFANGALSTKPSKKKAVEAVPGKPTRGRKPKPIVVPEEGETEDGEPVAAKDDDKDKDKDKEKDKDKDDKDKDDEDEKDEDEDEDEGDEP